MPVMNLSTAVPADLRKTHAEAVSGMQGTNGTHEVCQKHQHQQACERYAASNSETAAAALEHQKWSMQHAYVHGEAHFALMPCAIWRFRSAAQSLAKRILKQNFEALV